VVLGAANRDAPVAIDRRSCELLADRPDVERAGLLVEEGRFDLPTLGSNVLVLAVSTGLAPALSRYDAVVGSALGLSAGPHRLSGGAGVLDAVVDGSAIPTTGMSSAVTVALPSTVTSGDQCVVELSSHASAAAVSAELTAALSSAGGALAARPALRESVDVLSAHAHRAERILPMVVGGLGGLFVAVINALRSSAFAAYRLSGTRRAELLTLVWLEDALLAGLYACGGVAATVVLLGLTVEARAGVLWIGVGALTWVAVGTLGWAAAGRNPIRMAKDR
jgi:hypothetical protein